MKTQKYFVSLFVFLGILVTTSVLTGNTYVWQKANIAHPYTPTESTNSASQIAPAQDEPTKDPKTTSVAASATIDQSSLTTDSANPTITGTVSNIPQIMIIISKGNTTPSVLYDGPGSVPNQVWGGHSGNPGFSISNGHWRATVEFNRDLYPRIPILQSGTYTVAVYGSSHLLTYGVLTVN